MRPIYTARVGLGHHALDVVDGDVIVRFWIGTHAEYERASCARSEPSRRTTAFIRRPAAAPDAARSPDLR
jgi:hypothetical protein